MKNIFTRGAVALAVSSLLAVTSVSAFEQPAAEDLVGKAYGGLHLMHIDLDSKRWITSSPLSSLNNGDGFGGELGYRATENAEFRLAYSHINIDPKRDGFDGPNSSNIAFDVLYFPTAKNFYFLGGFSQLDVVETKLSSNLGLGYRHFLSEKAAVYLETKAHYQFDNYHDDFTTQLGFVYFFGDSAKKSSPKKSTPVAPVEAVAPTNLAQTGAYDHSHGYAGTHAHGDSATHTHSALNANATDGSADHTHGLAKSHTHNADGVAVGADNHTHSAADLLAMSKDSDNDGISDFDDNCTDSSAMYKVDANGCTVYMEDVASVNLSVNFANNSSVVQSQYADKINEVAEFLAENKAINVVIEGHASAQGDDAYNKFLSQKRANAIVTILNTKYGIDSDRLSAVGYGEEKLLNTANTAEAHAENRRIIATMSVDKKTPIAR